MHKLPWTTGLQSQHFPYVLSLTAHNFSMLTSFEQTRGEAGDLIQPNFHSKHNSCPGELYQTRTSLCEFPEDCSYPLKNKHLLFTLKSLPLHYFHHFHFAILKASAYFFVCCAQMQEQLKCSHKTSPAVAW